MPKPRWAKRMHQYKVWDETFLTDDPKLVSLYRHHRWRAIKLGIDFQFTFQSWIEWWETKLGSNWREKRGKMKGQYCMARRGDKGPYHPNNVKCILASENVSEQVANGSKGKGINTGEYNPRCKISNNIALAIYNSAAKDTILAAEFGVSRYTINDIRKGRSWTHITQRVL